jgi:hypothetical protein
MSDWFEREGLVSVKRAGQVTAALRLVKRFGFLAARNFPTGTPCCAQLSSNKILHLGRGLKMTTTREEHDKAMEAISEELASLGDELVDQGYSFDLVWLSMLMFVFEVLVHQKGKNAAWLEIKRLADNYFGGLSPEEEALIRRRNDPADKAN